MNTVIRHFEFDVNDHVEITSGPCAGLSGVVCGLLRTGTRGWAYVECRGHVFEVEPQRVSRTGHG